MKHPDETRYFLVLATNGNANDDLQGHYDNEDGFNRWKGRYPTVEATLSVAEEYRWWQVFNLDREIVVDTSLMKMVRDVKKARKRMSPEDIAKQERHAEYMIEKAGHYKRQAKLSIAERTQQKVEWMQTINEAED